MGAFNVGRECGVTPIIPPAMPPQQPLATPSLAKQPSNSTLIHTKTPQIEQCNVIRRGRGSTQFQSRAMFSALLVPLTSDLLPLPAPNSAVSTKCPTTRCYHLLDTLLAKVFWQSADQLSNFKVASMDIVRL